MHHFFKESSLVWQFENLNFVCDFIATASAEVNKFVIEFHLKGLFKFVTY